MTTNNFEQKIKELHEDLRPLFSYDPVYMCYIRNCPQLVTNNMYKEFLYVFEKQYGKFEEDDYKIVACTIKDEVDGLDCLYEDNPFEGELCCCTHPIKNLYYIENIKHKQAWLVGSECVKKVSSTLYEQTRKYKIKTQRKREGKICGFCEEPLVDLRKKYQKIGYCDYRCYKKSQYKINFGKHKGKILNEFVYTKNGFNYVQWVKKVLKDDKYAFRQYPLFLEIIENIDLELTEN